ncbi:hypothetical protein GCM10022247_35940 [Allokutzneria multivorans]|uniref:Uncharacterized protein n=1 Tax=Allokutzneria multivorans TaxID=1142134 RepID=A0ABP7SE79_9PSEU
MKLTSLPADEVTLRYARRGGPAPTGTERMLQQRRGLAWMPRASELPKVTAEVVRLKAEPFPAAPGEIANRQEVEGEAQRASRRLFVSARLMLGFRPLM